MTKQTPLHSEHLAAGARMVDFSGWDMPIHYGSQVEEHHQVRNAAGMFDVSHMTVVDLAGERVREFLRYLLANDVERLTLPGKALYSCMLNADGGVIDDLIVYFINDSEFRMVVNAGTREKDLAWINAQAAAFAVSVRERDDLAMVAVQGPEARTHVLALLETACRDRAAELAPFFGQFCGEWFIARTGYTGEDGFEVVLPATEAAQFWRDLAARGVRPTGLGARDTLRLEAGMNLYGADMDETTTPLESALGWTVAWEPAERDFIGREVMEKQRAEGVPRRLVGLLLEDKGVLRNHQKILVNGLPAGEITSGSFSPTLGKSIAFARIDSASAGNGACEVEVRGRRLSARIVKAPFVRNGKTMIE